MSVSIKKSPTCFPSIHIFHPKARRYFQYVSVYFKDGQDVSELLGPERLERRMSSTTFLDTVWDLKSPFMKTVYPWYCNGPNFEDSPEWELDEDLSWVAHCYALDKDMRFLFGVRWGFCIKKKKIRFITPSVLKESRLFRKYLRHITSLIDLEK